METYTIRPDGGHEMLGAAGILPSDPGTGDFAHWGVCFANIGHTLYFYREGPPGSIVKADDHQVTTWLSEDGPEAVTWAWEQVIGYLADRGFSMVDLLPSAFMALVDAVADDQRQLSMYKAAKHDAQPAQPILVDEAPYCRFPITDEPEPMRRIWLEVAPAPSGVYITAYRDGDQADTEATGLAAVAVDFFDNRLQVLLWDERHGPDGESLWRAPSEDHRSGSIHPCSERDQQEGIVLVRQVVNTTTEHINAGSHEADNESISSEVDSIKTGETITIEINTTAIAKTTLAAMLADLPQRTRTIAKLCRRNPLDDALLAYSSTILVALSSVGSTQDFEHLRDQVEAAHTLIKQLIHVED